MVSHVPCSAFISLATQTEPSAPRPQYSEQMPMGSRAMQKYPVRSSYTTHAKMPSRLFHSASVSPYCSPESESKSAQSCSRGSGVNEPCAASAMGILMASRSEMSARLYHVISNLGVNDAPSGRGSR